MLLNLYRYSAETRNKLIGILQQIRPRLWVPHQAALEYQRNRLDVICEQREAYNRIEKFLHDTHSKLESELKNYSRHPLINAEDLLAPLNVAFAAQAQELERVRQKHPNLLETDDVLQTLTKLLEGRVGTPYPEDQLQQIFKNGAERYSKLVPPGYEDAKSKAGVEKYGDLVWWFQTIDKAKADDTSIIMVTDDAKEDWWLRLVAPAEHRTGDCPFLGSQTEGQVGCPL